MEMTPEMSGQGDEIVPEMAPHEDGVPLVVIGLMAALIVIIVLQQIIL